MKPSLRLGLSAAALASLALVTGACSKNADPQVTAQGVQVTSPSATTPNVPTTKEKTGTTEPGSIDIDTPPATDKKPTTTAKGKTTTTKAAKKTGPEFGIAAAEAFKTKLGDFKAIEMVVHPDQPRAEVKVQDPAKPANVDDYEYTGGEVSDPSPVKLSGDGALEDNLFLASSIAWDKLPAMFEQATASIPAEGSKGVTHFIVKKNLPFDSDTVINVYVDGGPRGDGGYVSFLPDGTLKKVYGPS
jgi:hypothetical protein